MKKIYYIIFSILMIFINSCRLIYDPVNLKKSNKEIDEHYKKQKKEKENENR